MRSNLLKAQSAWHGGCVACGIGHPHGLQLGFIVSQDGRVQACFPCDRCFEGYAGCLHGGIIATLLDSAMTNCMFAHGLAGFTGELKVRFHQPVRTGKPARVCAWLERSSRRLHALRAEVEQDGAIKAVATARFLAIAPGEARDPAGVAG
jgi:uncharacterized protein (TIGR00369 family)